MQGNKAKLTVEDAIKFVMAANVVLPAAAQRASREMGQDIEIVDILDALVQDPSGLLNHLKMKAILDLYDILNVTRMSYEKAVAELSAGDISRAYASQLAAFTNLVAKPLEEMADAPTDINDAKKKFTDRLVQYKKRRGIDREEITG